ncbi:MAG: anti-sigma factor family protein [Candidatus Binatia bacterium]
MACNRTRRLVFLWIDREREASRRAPLERHLAACPSCRSRANEVERVLLLLRTNCARREVPVGLVERIRVLLVEGQET